MCQGHASERRLAPFTLSDLSAPERGLLAAMRLWFRSHPDSYGALPPIRERLRRGGAPDAVLLPLFGFLGILTSSLRSPLDAHCVDCARVGADEARLLAVIAAHHHLQESWAATALDARLPLIVREPACDAAASVARALAAGGIVLPWREAAAAGQHPAAEAFLMAAE
jgi:hypothetical protein